MLEPNQNHPSEREWSIEEREEFFASQDAITGFITGVTAANGAVGEPSQPITLNSLLKMKAEFDAQFPEPLKYQHGADMSPQTFTSLGLPRLQQTEVRLFSITILILLPASKST